MHTLTKLSSLEGDLLRKLGKGREYTGDEGRLTLGFTPQLKCELVIECMLEGQPLHLGVLETQWCTWLAAELPVPSWHMLAEDLRLPLAALTLVPLQHVLQALGLRCPTIRKIGRTPRGSAHKGWFLRLECDDRILNLQLLNMPIDWLASLINALKPVHESNDGADSRLASVPLVAGWTTLERVHLQNIRCGDALVLRCACQVGEDRGFLFMRRPLGTVKIISPDTLEIESIMSDVNDWLDVQAVPCTDNLTPRAEPLVTVVAEIARIELALDRLTRLEKGDVLEGLIHQDELVTLKIGGHPFAHGILLDIAGQLAVRIERLAGTRCTE